jgi:hypothetical protein
VHPRGLCRPGRVCSLTLQNPPQICEGCWTQACPNSPFDMLRAFFIFPCGLPYRNRRYIYLVGFQSSSQQFDCSGGDSLPAHRSSRLSSFAAPSPACFLAAAGNSSAWASATCEPWVGPPKPTIFLLISAVTQVRLHLFALVVVVYARSVPRPKRESRTHWCVVLVVFPTGFSSLALLKCDAQMRAALCVRSSPFCSVDPSAVFFRRTVVVCEKRGELIARRVPRRLLFFVCVVERRHLLRPRFRLPLVFSIPTRLRVLLCARARETERALPPAPVCVCCVCGRVVVRPEGKKFYYSHPLSLCRIHTHTQHALAGAHAAALGCPARAHRQTAAVGARRR